MKGATFFYRIILVLFVCYACSKSDASLNSSNLELVKFVPNELDTIFFKYPTNVFINSNSNLLINDNNRSSIFLFDQNLKFKKTISRKGRGPGEFTSPRVIGFTENEIIVRDVSNSRILFFEINGGFKGSLDYSDFIIGAHYSDSLIYYTSISADSDSLITVINREGDVIRRFGRQLEVKDHKTNSVVQILSTKNKLFVLFKYYPVMRIYSKTGILEQEIVINKDEYQDYLDINSENVKTQDNLIKYEYYFLGAHIYNENIYLARNMNKLHIEVFDLNGKFLGFLENSSRLENYTVFDITVTDSLLYVLESAKYPGLGVYKIKDLQTENAY